MPSIDVSIIVISFNTRDLTLACLNSVFEHTSRISYQVIVVDNASIDGSPIEIAARFPQADLIAVGDNLGFARGNNLAVEHATGKYLLLLNPDTIVLDRAIEKLHAFAEHRPDAGIFGGRTLFPDGSLNPASCWGRPTPWSAFCLASGLTSVFRGTRAFDPESLGWWARDYPREVDIVTGCFLLMRRDLWDRLGGFDDAFFMYGEEADLCLRARRARVRCVIYPEAQIIHYGGASERVLEDKMVRLFSAKARLFRKHWSPIAARFGVFTLDLWAWSRAIAFGVLQRVRPERAASHDTWRAIWRRRAEWRRDSAAILQPAASGDRRPIHASASPESSVDASAGRAAARRG
ncbi:MAG: glycosyltransferase family 2 protein [Planctomycetes bacterium]|nr:glycosyltransferase family 2 protein [Planctomycetota bacterium]MBI3843457.1 glycosyltransferase family 2 protein [Planctomycetota bacterium]